MDGGLATPAAAPHGAPGGWGVPCAWASGHHSRRGQFLCTRACMMIGAGRGLAPSAGTAKGAAAASVRANVLAMQAKCRSTDRPARLPNQQQVQSIRTRNDREAPV